MLGILNGLATAIGNILIDVLNGLIVIVGGIIAAILSVFPSMPAAPSLGAGNDWIGWLNYFLPLGGLLAGFMVYVAIWITMLTVRIAARWVKAL